jgi:hypothetical protein
MKIEILKEEYPKLFSRFPEEIDTVRDLLVIDENENDGDVDELDEVDAEDYNVILYLTETLQKAIGEEPELIKLIKKLDTCEAFDDFFPSEIDLYGIKTELSEEEISKIVFDSVEKMLS